MSEEIKINIHLFNINEEAELENKVSFHLEEFTNEIMRTMSKDRDIIILKKVIEKQQKELEIWKETENDYEHELARKDEKIEKQQKEIEELKEDLSKKVKALDIAMSNPDYICKDKIREKIKEYQHKLCQDIEEEKVIEYENILQVLKELLGE